MFPASCSIERARSSRRSRRSRAPVFPERQLVSAKSSPSQAISSSVEFYKGNQTTRALLQALQQRAQRAREKEQSSLFSPAFIKPVRLLTADELSTRARRLPAAGGPENRDALLLARDFTELDSLIIAARRMDVERVPVHGQGEVPRRRHLGDRRRADLRHASKTVPAKLWSDPTSDPLADIRGALRLVSSQLAGQAPT